MNPRTRFNRYHLAAALACLTFEAGCAYLIWRIFKAAA